MPAVIMGDGRLPPPSRLSAAGEVRPDPTREGGVGKTATLTVQEDA
eukprot:CAMPEP_0181182060 /NCGR_PEP_ID=MMETSP1096-20121128/7678_1 /TAXON_ID=156174 ORGANISM="Chrysochromulina ericina, Strain CCMP281" /NCGR_SAMPLE_ID=MMETSP1096 /ASSEMBLY_ACC=CAM_ASM_000453 /LENGTH=45 /DNA_ID= /DNA_START= /DNA_END= /DNA_ORIENTATION=